MSHIPSFRGASRFLALTLAFVMLPVSAFAATLTRELDMGSVGADVSSLQSYLAQDASMYPQGLVTGYFGSLTASAVSNFQGRNGIPTVGRVGPVTLAALNAQMNDNTVGSNHTAPTIGQINLGVTNSGATMNWNTSEGAAAIVYYSTSPLALTEASAHTAVIISGETLLVNTDLRTAHAAALTNLQSNTTYYYAVYVRDAGGNASVSWPSTFRTSN